MIEFDFIFDPVMLTPAEQSNVKELLDVVPLTDLFSVAASVTNKLIQIETKEDAVKAILLHECSYISLLNRKKITKNILLTYLHNQEVTCDGTRDKAALISRIIAYWSEKSEDQVDKNDKVLVEARPQSTEAVLAKQFTSWYYSKLNEDFLNSNGSILKEEDFWPDCQAAIHLPDAPGAETQDYMSTGPEDTVKLIRGLRAQYDLYFSPNLNFDGVRGKSDPHGLILIGACGTIHSRAGVCVGVFEQTFGLIADPMMDHNYKIKKTAITLRKGVSAES